MTTEQKIEAIKLAIENAKNLQSKMDQVAWSVPALSSLRIRHLMNNLGAISTRYLECGVHVGGLFCSTIRNNPNLINATANDNFASDETTEKDNPVKPRFWDNASKCCSPSTTLTLLEDDTFNVQLNPEDNQPPFDLYLYDADHSYESQRKAMTHFLPVMADEFIVCIDDFDWDDVHNGTYAGLEDLIKEDKIEILFENKFVGNNHDNDGWWNGFWVALLKKK